MKHRVGDIVLVEMKVVETRVNKNGFFYKVQPESDQFASTVVKECEIIRNYAHELSSMEVAQ